VRVVRLGDLDGPVEDADDGAARHAHVAGVDAVDGLVLPPAWFTPAAATSTAATSTAARVT
jgi:hypothetical protein